MKAFCCIAASASLLIAVPAMAGQVNGSGGGITNIWSSAQGTSNSYGNANAFGTSLSGSMATAAGRGAQGLGAGITQAMTLSNAGTSSNGSGYAQAQTSGYSGGSATGYANRGR